MMKPGYVRVIIDRAIHRELDYSVPEGLGGRVTVGTRVRVPFREKSGLATVVATLDESNAQGIRPIEAKSVKTRAQAAAETREAVRLGLLSSYGEAVPKQATAEQQQQIQAAGLRALGQTTAAQ